MSQRPNPFAFLCVAASAQSAALSWAIFGICLSVTCVAAMILALLLVCRLIRHEERLSQKK